MSETVLVTGGKGLLGSILVPHLRKCGHNIVTHARRSSADCHANLASQKAAFKLLSEHVPDVIINLVGLTDVELCETKPDEAFNANVRAVENIADWIKETQAPCHLIQISTDHVYDSEGLNTEQQVTLKNCYALSKYAGELAAKAVSSTVIRTNFFGRSGCENRQSLTDWLFGCFVKGEKIQVFEN